MSEEPEHEDLGDLPTAVRDALLADTRDDAPSGVGGRVIQIARRIVIAVVGFSVVAVGVAMMVLPGPAFVVIPAGLAILALEFSWAKRWLVWAKRQIDRFRSEASSAQGAQESPDANPAADTVPPTPPPQPRPR